MQLESSEVPMNALFADSLPAAFAALAVFALGSIWFGRFEESTPKWRRTLKLALIVTCVAGTAARFGQGPAFALLLAFCLVGLGVHFTWCRRHAIDPWTAEPWARYRQLRGWPT